MWFKIRLIKYRCLIVYCNGVRPLSWKSRIHTYIYSLRCRNTISKTRQGIANRPRPWSTGTIIVHQIDVSDRFYFPCTPSACPKQDLPGQSYNNFIVLLNEGVTVQFRFAGWSSWLNCNVLYRVSSHSYRSPFLLGYIKTGCPYYSTIK